MGAVERPQAYGYEVQGTANYRTADKKTGDAFIEQNFDFVMWVDGCKWLLKKTPTLFTKNGKSQDLEDYIVASTDLTNFYYLVSMKGILESAQRRGAKLPPDINIASGMIGKGIAPYGKDPTVPLLWYALASGCYFQGTVTNQYIPGVFSFVNSRYYANDDRVEAAWSLDGRAPYLPKRIVFSGKYKFLQEHPDPGFSEWLYPTSCVYTALEFTNIGSLYLPKLAKAEFPNTNRFETTFQMHVASVAETSGEIDFKPALPGRSLISDYRSVTPYAPVVVPTDSKTEWPTLASTQAKSRQAAQVVKESSNKRSHMRIIFVFCLLSSSLVIFYYFGHKLTNEPS